MPLTEAEAENLLGQSIEVKAVLEEVIDALTAAAEGTGALSFQTAQKCSVVANKAMTLGHAIVTQMGDND